MKNLVYVVRLSIFLAVLSSCQGKKAIETVKKAKVTSNSLLLNFYFNGGSAGTELTWESFVNLKAKQTPNIKYTWSSEKTDENGIYLVAFADNNKSGRRWQVDVNSDIVIFVNDSEYLSRKYRLHRMDKSNKFELTGIEVDTLRFFRKGSNIAEID